LRGLMLFRGECGVQRRRKTTWVHSYSVVHVALLKTLQLPFPLRTGVELPYKLPLTEAACRPSIKSFCGNFVSRADHPNEL
jgi:hypothetical protein